MKKELSLKNYLVYAFRYWLILAICAVVGLGAGLGYGILTNRKTEVTYEGNIAINGISTFAEDLSNLGDSSSATDTYNSLKSNALDVMSASLLRTELYREVRAEWERLNKISGDSAREAFFTALDISKESFYVYASFSQSKDDETSNAFSMRVVNTYLDLARTAAEKHDALFVNPEGRPERLTVTRAERKLISTAAVSMGMMTSCAVGTAIGVVAAFIIVFVMYWIDRRITSYNDIADVTGRRLLGVDSKNVGGDVCPKIDCAMNGEATLLLCGNEDTVKRLSQMYAAYAVTAGYSPLLIDFSRPDETADSFGDYMRGEPIEKCVQLKDGIAVLKGGSSWALALKNADKTAALEKIYGRIVICAPYRGDGALSVLAKVCDKVVYAVDQSAMRIKEALYMVEESQANDKAAGAVIENTGKSFVGGGVYFASDEEE